MATSVGSAAAEGLQSGFGLGLRLDSMNEEKRARKFQEGRELEADQRAQEDLQLRRTRESRQKERLNDQERRDRADRAHKLLKERRGELVTAATRAQESGGPIPPEVEAEFSSNAQASARLLQDAQNWTSRLATNQTTLDETPPKQLAMNVTALTGRHPDELPAMRQNIEDVQAGLETGNKGLVLQGVNGMMGPSLKKGVGGPSPYGGMIVRKEIIGLDPARSADGQDHPDKFIPRLRVYVKTDDGQARYYDAPVTKNRSTDPNDPVVAVNMGDAMEFMGNMSVLTTALEHPEIKAKLDEGVKAAGPELQKYLDELRTVSRPTKKLETTEKVALPADSGETVLIKRDAQGKEIGRETLKHAAKPFRPSSGGGGGARGALQAKLDAIDAGVEDGTFTDDEGAEMKKAAISGIKPGAGKTPKGPSNAELNAGEQKALDAVAGKLGLEYDLNLKTYKNRDGTPATPEQKTRLGAAKEAINKTSRDAAAKGERTAATALVGAGEGAAGAKAKYTEGQTATNPKTGEKLIFKGGGWQPAK